VRVCLKNEWVRSSVRLMAVVLVASTIIIGCERRVRVRVKVGVTDAGTSSSTVAE